MASGAPDHLPSPSFAGKFTMKNGFNHLSSARRSRVSGVTLIELLVSLVIGLLLAIAASATYLYSKQSYSAVTENSQMEENGRFALTLLTRYIQSAGNVMLNPQSNSAQGALSIKIRGCDLGFTNARSGTGPADIVCRTATPAGERRSSSISTFFETDAPNLAGARFEGFNCIGNSAAAKITTGLTGATFTTYQASSHLFISTETVPTQNGATTTMGQLSCAPEDSTTGAISLSQPLIPGIEQLSVVYLLPAIQTVSGEVPRLAQTPLTAAQVDSANRWGEVVAVDLCVLTRSIQPAGNDTGTQYTDCFGTALVTTGSESFRTFRTTVNLRNRTPAL
jgi:type IV pilus assembly protein PilW